METKTSLSALVLLLGLVGLAFAASNPSGTGQPSQSCGSATATSSPTGFNTDGFSHAETVYAGSDGAASANHAQSDKAVSQYDVACYQVTQNQH